MVRASAYLLAAGGLAIDISLAYMLKNQMSKALDTAGLAAGRVAFETYAADDAEKFFNANIDSNLPVRADETIIVAEIFPEIFPEIFFDYEPFFGLLIDPARFRHVAYFRPRLGSLQTLDP